MWLLRHRLILLLIALPTALACNGDNLTVPDTGTLEVTTSTSGPEPDPDGYTVQVDVEQPKAIGATGSLQSSELSAGSHTVLLSGAAPNCVVAGENPRTVSITAGQAATISFAITCAASSPSPRVSRWASIPLGNAYHWSDLWASTPTNILVTGVAFEPDRSAVWHYDGQSWSEQLQRGDTTVAAIWGSSAADIFAVGHRSLNSDFGLNGAVLHYDGSQWSDIAAPGHDYYAIWGTSPRDVFAGGNSSRVMRYDGSQWSEMPTTGFGPEATIQQISGISPTDVWAIGWRTRCDDCSHRTYFVARYDGRTWTTVYSTSDNTFNALWVGAANDVWVVGVGYNEDGYILHYDGTTWQETFRRSAADIASPPIDDVWGSSSSDIYAVGGEGVLHYDGASWTVIDSRPAQLIWGTSLNDVFVLDQHEVRHGMR